VLLHLVDVSAEALEPPIEALRVVEDELARYSPSLATRPRLVVATKCEDDAAEERAAELARLAGRPVERVSVLAGKGVRELVAAAWRLARAPGR
jgi:GTP-binding protein